jgi:hypothetical protein
MKQKQTTFFTLGVLVLTIALFIACKDKPDPDDPPPPQPPQNASITFRDKSITVDYSGSGLTQEQADTVTPKLQEIFTTFSNSDPDELFGMKLDIMVNRPGFKIVIIPGDSGPGRDGDTMTLGADFVLGNDLIDIRISVGQAIANDNLFADIPTIPQPTTITQTNGLAFNGKVYFLAFDGAVTIKTSDQYTAADWDAVVAIVIMAFNMAYEAVAGPGESQFRAVFGNDAGGEIVLVNNLNNNWEVRDGEFKTLYLKTSSRGGPVYIDAVNHMNSSVPGVG